MLVPANSNAAEVTSHFSFCEEPVPAISRSDVVW